MVSIFSSFFKKWEPWQPNSHCNTNYRISILAWFFFCFENKNCLPRWFYLLNIQDLSLQNLQYVFVWWIWVATESITAKPYILQKILFQWICCKCLAWGHRHSYFWPQRSWRLLEAKNTPWRPKIPWRSWFIKKSI